MKNISEGKLKGLKNISTRDGFFIITALDHRNSLRKLISPGNPGKVGSKDIENLKVEFVRALAPSSSAVLLDPTYGIPATKKSVRGKCGLIMSLEESDYEEKNRRRFTELIKDFGVKELKKMNADAAKILLYYRPDDASSKVQLELVREVAEECKNQDVAFVCEPFVYPIKGEEDFDKEFPSMVIETAKQISKLGIDVLKVQFPGKVELFSSADLESNCRELGKVCEVPWVLLSGGAKYEDFKRQVEIASGCGASGIMVGRALWQEAFENSSSENILKFVRTEAVKRLNRLSLIAKEGVPWTDIC